MSSRRKNPTVSEYCYGSAQGTRGTRKDIREILMSSEMEWVSVPEIVKLLMADYEYPETVGKTDIPLHRAVSAALADMFRDGTHHVQPQRGDSQLWRYNPGFAFAEDEDEAEDDEPEPAEVTLKPVRKPRRGQPASSQSRRQS